ncbi:hypothetical protein ABIC86_000091 [Paenibacillus sp. DS2363]|uniref:hypothetical protein n=1 Tax=Paenibacillus sp. DS2363 TaxID=3156427 RepID=UPI003390A2FE
MADLTKKYITEHALKVHDYNSFGRALVEKVLLEAASKFEDEETSFEQMEFDVKVKIEPYKPESCTIVVILGIGVHTG